MSKNEITGDRLISKNNNDNYKLPFDANFVEI